MPNALQFESSPYLLQHKNNPVNWFPWDEKHLEQAEREDKLVLVSIGYSACHWCHVMEHEVFEDKACAERMNRDFINIKVDREERPDIDHVYMNALQLMTGSGGWPLNCILLPDGRPVYGGTYFPKERWLQTLQNLTEIWKTDRDKMYEYADKLHHAMQMGTTTASPPLQETTTSNHSILVEMVQKWRVNFDADFGGPRKAPKFPLPTNYAFLLRYALREKDEDVLQHVEHTLKMMAFGGIYDQIGGGFSRYSVDQYWKVPHFEKMLYDNAQLIGLYAEAYAVFGEKLFAETVHETVTFCQQALSGMHGGWMSALDADSEGEEGKFYVWKIEELQQILGTDFDIAQDYYNVNAEGYWEHDKYILMRQTEDEIFAKKHELSLSDWITKREHIKSVLLAERNKRIHPGTDDKVLLSWNALYISGLCKAYIHTKKCSYLALAEDSWLFLEQNMFKNDCWMRSYKNNEAKIPAFIEDYAFLMEAAIQLAQASFNVAYLDKAKEIGEKAIQLFWDEKAYFFKFKANTEKKLTAETYEIQDNVIPAANSQMAINLFMMARILGIDTWEKQALGMLEKIKPLMSSYAPGYSNWAILAQYQDAFTETVFVGPQAHEKALDYVADFKMANFVAASKENQVHPLFANRFMAEKTLRYDCKNRACELPVEV